MNDMSRRVLPPPPTGPDEPSRPRHGRADPFGCLFQLFDRNAADRGGAFRRIVSRNLLHAVEPYGMRNDKLAVHPPALDQQVDYSVHQRDVRTGTHLQMQVGALVHGRRFSRVGDDDPGPVPVLGCKHAFPQHRLRLGHVVAVQAKEICLVNVDIGSDRTVGTKIRHQTRCRCRGAEPRVAVDIR